MQTQTTGGGVTVISLLGLLFVGLKLGGVIDWSWWWVTAPFWGPGVLILGIAIIWLVSWCWWIIMRHCWSKRT